MRSIKKFFIVLLCTYVVYGQLGAMDTKHVRGVQHPYWFGIVRRSSFRFDKPKPLTGAQRAQQVFSVLKLTNLLVKRGAQSKKDFVGRLSLHGIRIICSLLDIWNHPEDSSYRYLLPWMALDMYRSIQDGRALLKLIKGQNNKESGGNFEHIDQIFEEDAFSQDVFNDAVKPSNQANYNNILMSIASLVESGSSFFAVSAPEGDVELARLYRKKWNGICSMSRLISELSDTHNSKEIRAGLLLLLLGHGFLSYRDFDGYTKEKYSIEECAKQKRRDDQKRAEVKRREEQQRREEQMRQQREAARRRAMEEKRVRDAQARRRNQYSALVTDLTNVIVNAQNIVTTNDNKPAVDCGTDCSICLEDWKKPNENIVLTRCRHAFHRQCIERWFQRVERCPLCSD